ncbi:LCP family protein [Pimelobacter simplex]|uniref:LCP family protein n=1 Tax=Nocardioides simplex TaxID=2045 RepID=UPI00214F88DF|nr:LCP family protein [Pimelobacter simplex]UUW91904.1 LCP family protein [Pimelobacter simplex]UUW95731.1 LCP family protein [Pimelobacter simplex]
MTQDVETSRAAGEPSVPGSRARRVPTSRASRASRDVRRPRGRRGRGRRKAPQPGKTVFKVIAASLLSLAMATGVGVVLVYNNWNNNLKREDVSTLLSNRPAKEQVAGPSEPLNILVMGSDTRAGKGNGIDGEAGGGLSDTTILFHLSANREFAYGISIPRDTAVMRPECKRKGGGVVPAAGGYEKWNAAYAVGGPSCTIQQFEQLSKIRVDKYVVVDFNQFKDMVNALGGVEVCIPEDIDDNDHDIHLKAGTREIKGNEALAYVRVRYRVGDGTDTQRTRRQQAFIGSMISKALSADMLARPDHLIGFMNAATSSLQTDFKSIAQMADLAVTARGTGADNIKFVTTPWAYSDKVSGGIEWTPEVLKLWQLVRKDKPLTPEFLKDALSAGDKPDGTASAGTPGGPSGTTSGSASGSASNSPSGTASNGATNGKPGQTPTQDNGLSTSGREQAGLCT